MYNETIHYDPTKPGGHLQNMGVHANTGDPSGVNPPADATKVAVHLPPPPQQQGVYTADITPAMFADIKGTRPPNHSDIYTEHQDSVKKAMHDPWHKLNEPTISDVELQEHKERISGLTKVVTAAGEEEAQGQRSH